MKTFTLRLSDLEAEALERIAFVSGVSKNKALQQLIAKAYEEIEPGATEAGEIFLISDPGFLAYKEIDGLPEKPTREELIKILRILNYALETGDEYMTPEQIAGNKQHILELLRNL